eukprot:TRINITY_DN2438_c0_g1_i2.p1 TRINITY_DN2438_c0_g1~~TRINITY_DN2438_c0_g1_i2.p1  ORF type:complete len:252 (-),score=41.70 TRINITY_DN2438_c0_g1_i2:27-782(-)
MMDCASKIIKKEGAPSLWRGITAPIISLTILNMLSFTAFGQVKAYLQARYEMKPYLYFLAGSCVGLYCGIISTPFEMVKVQLQLDNIQEKKYKGSFHCAKGIIKEKGILSLYRGYTINAPREVLFCGLYFGLYENFKSLFFTFETKFFRFGGESPSALAVLFAGGFSGMLAWAGSFPLDVVKSNIQGTAFIKKVRAKDVVIERWLKYGVAGFFKGIKPSVLRAFFTSGTRFSAFEFAYQTLTRLEEYRLAV